MALHQFLAGRFSREFIKTPFWRSNMLKGYVLLKHSPICSQLSFESAAIIGEYYSPEKEVFVDLLGDPGKIERSGILNSLKELSNSKLSDFGGDPKDFSDLLMKSERTRILTHLGNVKGITEGSGDLVWDAYLKQGNMKIPAISFLSYLSFPVIVEAFGVGLHHPHLVRKLWRNSYEVISDTATVDLWVKYGVLTDVERKAVMEPKPLKERQTQLLPIVREYVSKHFPDHAELLH